jgi:tetratricopeptide (TPR) repeat protein
MNERNELDGLEELDDPVAGLLGAVLVRRLRLRHGLQRAAEMTGLTTRTLQRYEKGEAAPPPKTLDLLGRQAGYTRHLLDHLRSSLAAYRLAEAGGLTGEPASPGRTLAEEVIAAALEAIEAADALFVVEPAPAPWEETGQPRPEDRQRADELWRRFMGVARDRRYRLVRDSSAFRLWSFAERLAHESNATAADSPAEALGLARLALEIARDIHGTPSWRARVEAYVLPFFGNAHRVSNDLDQARAAFGEARKLEAAFAASDPSLLDGSRAADLEASLKREERRFPEALVLHEESLALCPTARKGAVLLNKAFTLEQMGDCEGALETLREAEPHVLATGTPRDLWCLRVNTAVCKCHLGLAGEAEELLPEIQGLADRLGKGLDRLRTRWLTARVAAGLGRTEVAVAVLDRVCDDFLRGTPPLPIDAALAGLDLALYWLEQGNTAAVKKLAVPLERLFAVQGIRREALSALRLFCEAARREAATLEMVNKAKAELARRA